MFLVSPTLFSLGPLLEGANKRGREKGDNKPIIIIANNPIQHDMKKHIEIDRHFIKEKLEAKVIEVSLVWYQDQLTDIFTKAISSQAILKFLLCDIKINLLIFLLRLYQVKSSIKFWTS